MPGPMSLAMNDPHEMANLGMQYLQSGKVSPDEVDSVMSMIAPPSGNAGPTKESDAVLNAVIAGKKPGDKSMKFQNKKDTRTINDTKASSTRNTYLDPDSFQGLTQIIENTPGIQEQRKGITDMESLLKMQDQQPVDNSSYWIKPLAAYVDSTTGSKLSAANPQIETQAQRNQRNVSALDDLQKRKGELSKAILEGVTKLKSGTDTNSQNQNTMQLLSAMVGNMNQSKYGDPEDRMAFQAHQANIRALKKDTLVRQNLSNFQRIENGLNNAVSADKLTNESFHELQQAIRSSITKGSGGVDERAATYYSSLGMDAKKFLQYLDSKPQSLNKNDPFVQHVLQLGQLELKNIKRQNESAAKLLLGGNASLYADPRYAHYKADLEDLTGSLSGTFEPQIDPKVQERMNAGKKKKAAPAPSPVDDLNADLSKMTPQQLEAWVAKHGG